MARQLANRGGRNLRGVLLRFDQPEHRRDMPLYATRRVDHESRYRIGVEQSLDQAVVIVTGLRQRLADGDAAKLGGFDLFEISQLPDARAHRRDQGCIAPHGIETPAHVLLIEDLHFLDTASEEFIAKFRKGLQDHADAAMNPRGYAGWPIWVASGRKPL